MDLQRGDLWRSKAQEIGLVQAIFEPESLLEETLKRASTIAGRSRSPSVSPSK